MDENRDIDYLTDYREVVVVVNRKHKIVVSVSVNGIRSTS